MDETWISVEVDMPPEETDVWAFATDPDWFHPIGVLLAQWDGRHWYSSEADSGLQGVTHWLKFTRPPPPGAGFVVD